MKCPCCSTEAKSLVKETRKQAGELARRRECTACGGMFFTREFFDPAFKINKPRPKKDEDRRRTSNNDLFKVWGKA